MIILVPERPSLENRELSPVPDVVSPTSPILAQSYHNQNTYSQPRTVSRRDMRQGEVTREDHGGGVNVIYSRVTFSPDSPELNTGQEGGGGGGGGAHQHQRHPGQAEAAQPDPHCACAPSRGQPRHAQRQDGQERVGV